MTTQRLMTLLDERAAHQGVVKFRGSDRKELARYLALSQVGMEMVVPIILGLVLDYYLGWSPWGVVVGAIIGLVGGLAHLIQLSNQDDPPSTPKKPPESG